MKEILDFIQSNIASIVSIVAVVLVVFTRASEKAKSMTGKLSPQEKREQKLITKTSTITHNVKISTLKDGTYNVKCPLECVDFEDTRKGGVLYVATHGDKRSYLFTIGDNSKDYSCIKDVSVEPQVEDWKTTLKM